MKKLRTGPLIAVAAVVAWAWMRVRFAPVQDDAAYAVQSQLFVQGVWEIHPDNFAAVWPQALLGAAGWKLFGTPLALIWLTNAAASVTAIVMRSTLGWTWTRVLGCMAIPYWIQYGSHFLYDIYGALWVALLLWSWAKSRASATAVFAFLIPLQTQFLALVPAWCVAGDWKLRKKESRALVLGVVASVAMLVLLPKSMGQLGHLEFLKTKPFWKAETFAVGAQIVLGFGWFLIPLFGWKRISGATLVAALGVWIGLGATLWAYGGPLLAGGVMLIEYLPRPVQAMAVAFGFWGWFGTRAAWLKAWNQNRQAVVAGILTIGVIALFQGYRGVNDMRVALVWMPLVFWMLRSHVGVVLADKKWFVAAGLALSIVLNRSMIEIGEARTQWTRDLEARGVPREMISAGYGIDHFDLERECMRRELARLGEAGVKHSQFIEDVYRYLPQVYQRGWRPRYRILPTRVLGKSKGAVPEGYLAVESRSWKTLGVFPQEVTRFELEPRLEARAPECLDSR